MPRETSSVVSTRISLVTSDEQIKRDPFDAAEEKFLQRHQAFSPKRRGGAKVKFISKFCVWRNFHATHFILRNRRLAVRTNTD